LFGIEVTKIRPGQISTNIHNDWATNLLTNYQKAPTVIRDWYGHKAYSENVVGVFEASSKNGTSASMAKASLATNSLMDLLTSTSKPLKPYYWIGRDAHTFWKALHLLPTTVADTLKNGTVWVSPPITPQPPAVNTVSHVTIRVRSIEKSLPFYQAWGLELYGETANKMQFLTQPKNAKTMVLLQEDRTMKPRDPKHCFQLGMTRLSLLTTNLQEVKDRLAKAGFHPMTPVTSDNVIALAVYTDPDGYLVYMDEFKSSTVIGKYLRAMCWWNGAPNPVIFHWTVNVSNAKSAMSIFENLGFETLSDQNRDQVLTGLLPAFYMNPDKTVIEHIRLCHLPGDALHATIMEWVEPRATKAGYETLNSMTVSVSNVQTALQQAKDAGMTVPSSAIVYKRFPVFGTVPVVTAYVEDGNCPVEFCCFSEKY
jgi:catechol 2,3-dioxygenase-like lactoylglutathione lyase family enzyme